VEVAACDTRPDFVKRVATRYDCPGYASLDDALASSRWNAAVICTPAPSHLSIARKCLDAGMHVLLEKPLGTDLEEAIAFTSSYTGDSPVVRMAYVYRCTPAMMLAKSLLEQRNFGPIRHLTATCGQNFPSFRPAYRETYYTKHSTGGGAIQDALTHMVDYMQWMAGPIESLLCDADHQVLEGVEVEDTVNLATRHRQGAMGSLSLNQFQLPNENSIGLHAMGGSIKIEVHQGRVGELSAGADDWQWHDAPTPDRDGPFLTQARAFLDACAGQSSALATLTEGLEAMKVGLAALRGAASNKRETP